jgi:hypothetical protein
MVRADLAEAGIPYKDERGRLFDFHALRGQLVTTMVLAGVPLVKIQKFARHSTPNLTANAYTHLELDDLRGDVEKLPPRRSLFRTPKRPGLHRSLHHLLPLQCILGHHLALKPGRWSRTTTSPKKCQNP